MDRLRRAAVLTRLVEQMRRNGSWCGETHMQKATLFLQNLVLVPLAWISTAKDLPNIFGVK